jgi:1-Cys peroxiredoxin 6
MWVCPLFQSGGECMVLPTLKEEEAKELFPKGFFFFIFPSGKPYLRITPQP